MMRRGGFSPRSAGGAAIIAALASFETPAAAQERPDFDFYILALSWSPSYCVAAGDSNPLQCAPERDFDFIVHGLWPQYETGYPEYCASSEPERVDAELGRPLFDIMPGMGLIGHQWRKHGSCSGLTHEGYFDTVREAFEQIDIPDDLENVADDATVSPQDVEAAFIEANPGLSAGGIAVTCDREALREVRICLTKDLSFRACPEVDADACRRGDVLLPAPL